MIDVRQTLDALVLGQAGNTSVSIERSGDDAFEVSIVIGNAITKAPSFDLEQACGAAKWARDRGVAPRFVLSRWPRWNTLGIDARAKEVLRVCEAKATRIIVRAYAPATERGEEPMGQPSVALEAELAGGAPIEHTLAGRYTSRSDHESAVADFTKQAEELAAALGAPVEVRR